MDNTVTVNVYRYKILEKKKKFVKQYIYYTTSQVNAAFRNKYECC